MFRRRHLLFITFLLALVVLNKVHAYHDEDNDDDVGNEDYNYYNNYYHDHYEGDDCNEDKEGIQDREDLEEIARILKQKENKISRIDGQSLILPAIDDQTCSIKGLSNNVFRQFSAVIFGDVVGIDGMSVGPLAVKGNFTAKVYRANIDNVADCSDHGSLNAYGMAVNGFTDIYDFVVDGDVFTNGGSKFQSFIEISPQCSISDMKGTGLVDFDALETEANRLNNLYRDHPPTLQILEDGSLKRLANFDQGIDYFTFNTCGDSSTCEKIAKGQLSNPKEIFFGGKDYTGLSGMQDMTYVFNIPVIENTVINITSSDPSTGFNICNLVYNFYPVKQDTGEYSPTGEFTLQTADHIFVPGLTLAPRGRVFEGAVSYFYGQVFAKSFTWESTDAHGFLRYDYDSGDCTTFQGCVPNPPRIFTTTSFATVTKTESTKTIAQISTVTSKVDVTRTVTTTLKTEGTVTVTSSTNHATTITSCGSNSSYNNHDTITICSANNIYAHDTITICDSNNSYTHIHDENCEDEEEEYHKDDDEEYGESKEDEDNDDKNDGDNVDDDYHNYNKHYEGDDCSEDYEDVQDSKELEEIARILKEKEITPFGISRIDLQGSSDPPQETYTTTVFATTTITNGIEITTQLSTVTTNVEITQTVTDTLTTDGTVTVTSLEDHSTTITASCGSNGSYTHDTITITNCGSNGSYTHDTITITSCGPNNSYTHIHDEDCEDEEEEYHKDNFKNKWYHKEYDEDKDEDNCDEDNN